MAKLVAKWSIENSISRARIVELRIRCWRAALSYWNAKTIRCRRR